MSHSSLSRRQLLHWIGAGSALALTGCNAIKAANLEAPEVRVANVAMGRFDLSGLELLVDLHLRNPNDIDLPITGLEYNFILQGVKVAEGRQAKSQTLPALGETDMRLGLNVNLLSSAAQLVPMLLNPQALPKSLDYKVDGSVKLDWWYMPKIAFNRAGSVPLAGSL
ncbi:MAG TPA: LEA type 2 family protein [Dongiaceae bacterium]|nr:LEA type 2 family protein [Dongiaceae bacterium]